MIKKITILSMLIIAFASCESTSVEDEILETESDKPEVIDIYEDDSHGLGN
ncbi:hypothetical protein [uncultured Aquimarina sp.]|uniref:hypothetical protein n=1 Tax=uncultured Aquimarina sp. TaxID=575652 RepID=UPI00260DCA6B|nr:hypothetical protein [uncultured Aquimarina sp.]